MNCVVLFILVTFVFNICFSQQRLYYTGTFKNNEVTNMYFPGTILQHDSLFRFKHDLTPQFNNSFLYCGQTYLRLKSVNVTSIETEFIDGLLSYLSFDGHEFVFNSVAFYKQISSYEYGIPWLDGSPGNQVLLEAEIGLYDHSRDVFIEKYWREISGGELIAVNGVVSDSTTTEPTEKRSATSKVERHKLLYTRDYLGRLSALSHTWSEESPAVDVSAPVMQNEPSETTLSVMTYNLWHNNPPSWVYHDKNARWERYQRRLQHFADIVAAEDPDVIALQEVRHDSAFTSTSRKTAHWNDLTKTKEDAGAQVEHLLSALAMARARFAAKTNISSASSSKDVNGVNYYQFVSHPAMAMLDRHRPTFRNEEGLLILSKRPILQSDVRLLPRNIGDQSDDHQRIVLRVKVQLVAAGPGRPAETADIMTTHLSLSSDSRDIAAREIVKMSSCQQETVPIDGADSSSTDTDSIYTLSPIQVLTGDFNAEPDEPAVRHLLDGASYARTDCGTGASLAADSSSPFVDSWELYSRQRYNEQQDRQPSDLVEMEVGMIGEAKRHVDHSADLGYTFPSCNPVKRIDFVLVRNASLDSDSRQTSVRVSNSRIVGTQPTKDTSHLVGSREGLGMNDKDSPIWASDHFAVVTDLRVVYY